MQHRHIDSTAWNRTAIDSCLDRGDLPDWRDLFNQVRHDPDLAKEVLFVSEARQVDGASLIARDLVLKLWPELASSGERKKVG